MNAGMRGTRLPATVPKQKKATDTANRSGLKEPHRNPGYTANVAVGGGDPVRTLYRTLLAFGAFATIILAAGVAEYVHFEPFAPSAGLHAKVVGIYAYDPTTKNIYGPDRERFARNEQFAAVVDWSGLPDNVSVEAVWFDSFENVVGSVGPGTPSGLRTQTIVPAEVPHGLRYHLPGQYIFAIERLDNGRPVEVIGRRVVDVER